jgi:hypothetical protein
MSEPEPHPPMRGKSAFLFIIPGCILVGFGIGLGLRNPAPGLLVGLGMGALLWGLLVVVRR